MARFETVTCDVCGVGKKATNNWFIAVSGGGSGLVIDIASERDHYPEPNTEIGLVVNDICGEECIIKKVSELIAKMKGNQAGGEGRR